LGKKVLANDDESRTTVAALVAGALHDVACTDGSGRRCLLSRLPTARCMPRARPRLRGSARGDVLWAVLCHLCAMLGCGV